jgi:lipopolysaccharide transport system ATP-binding protein
MNYSNIEDRKPSITVNELSKSYSIWRDPKSRLKHPFLRLVRSFFKYLKGPFLKRVTKYIDRKTSEYLKHHQALSNISFQVSEGETVGILGLNGSGKSTLLQIIAGILQPTSGTITTNGRIAALLELGAGFNDEFTGRENAFLNGAILGVQKAEMEKRFDEIANFAEIGKFMDQPVKTYSSGMKLRLAFAVLTQINPDIIIIDEALSVGDAYFQHKCARKIQEFKEQGKTLLFVSHDPGLVARLCDRALLLENGVCIREGKSEDVSDYYNAIVAKKEKDEEIKQIETETGRTYTRSGNKKAEFGKIELLDNSNNVCRAFFTGSQASLTAEIEFKKSIANPTFGLLVRDRLGMDVFGANTFYDTKSTINPCENSTYSVEAQLTLLLGPGSYSITIAVHSGAVHTEESYDWIDHAIVFDVLPKPGQHFIGAAALPYKIDWT